MCLPPVVKAILNFGSSDLMKTLLILVTDFIPELEQGP